MKKVLLLAVSVLAVLAVTAQTYSIKADVKPDIEPVRNIEENLINRTPVVSNEYFTEKPTGQTKAGGIVTIIEIGESANAYGLYNGGRSAVWADDDLNSITFSHRMTANPGSGYVGYDISTDGGWTWTNNIQVYDPTAGGANARYPQGVIYNPLGNTDPANAYFTYFTATLDGSNTGGASWGGYAAGIQPLDQSVAPTQQDWSSQGAYRQNVPSTMTVNPVTGDIWVVECSLIDGLGNQYTDTLLVTKGVFNETTNDYDYTQSLVYLPSFEAGNGAADEKIAFAPDGMTGYISLLFDNGGWEWAAGAAYYPVLLKTTDGGITWSEPIAVELSGPNGLPEVKYYLTDEQWEEFWVEPDQVHRDSVVYQTAFDHDLVVDMFGNPHIGVTIGVGGIHSGTAYSILASDGYGATFHIYSLDQGDTWIGKYLTHNNTFRGEFGEISEDNRSQMTTTKDGSKVFISWLDTDFEGVEDNIMPDIWCVGFDMSEEPYAYTDVYNVTYLSEGWLEAFMGTASHYAFTDGLDYTIPFVYQTLAGGDPINPVQYKYIADFVINEADFINVGSEELPVREKTFAVSQNFPNPVNGTTQFAIELNRRSNVSVEVFNIMGQSVQAHHKGNLNAGSHLIQLDMNGFASGLYFYTVKTGDQTATRKMIVQ
jgi:hypothetical protein